ncbi:MAG: glycosyltransferase family 4 protein [Phycisphaerae bacterium]|nr:glycosyltransferase family 4 protein [Phycisphaerae bacterium]
MSLNIVHPTHRPEDLPPLHVLHVIDASCLARFGPMLRASVEHLRQRNIASTLLTDDTATAHDALGDETPIVGVPSFTGWHGWLLERYFASRLPHTPHAAHLWGLNALTPLRRWAASNQLPLVAHVTSRLDIERVLRRRPGPDMRVIASCDAQRAALARGAPELSGSVAVLKPAIALPATPAARDAERTPAIVWNGRLDRFTGLSVLIAAVSQLRREGRELHVALVGRDTGDRHTWAMIREHGVEDCFSLIEGPRFGELAVSAADILVIPAWQRAVAVAPLLAMASNVFVVASRDQTAEWFIEGETAVQFAPGSAQELAYHLTRLLEQRPSVVGILESARAYVKRYHAIEDRVSQIESLYRGLVEHASAQRKGAS